MIGTQLIDFADAHAIDKCHLVRNVCDELVADCYGLDMTALSVLSWWIKKLVVKRQWRRDGMTDMLMVSEGVVAIAMEIVMKARS